MLAAIIGAVLGSSGLTAWITSRANRRKIDAEVESIRVETADKVVELTGEQLGRMAAEIAKLETKVAELDRRLEESDGERARLLQRVEELSTHIDTLEALMRQHGVEPPPRPRSTGD